MKSITAKELSHLIKDKKDIRLIDVREQYEHDEFNIGGTLIPLGEVVKYVDTIEKEKPVVIYCRRGIRSQLAIQRLQEKFPFKNLINLIGGTEAWKEDVNNVPTV